jgi:hypothetical protein
MLQLLHLLTVNVKCLPAVFHHATRKVNLYNTVSIVQNLPPSAFDFKLSRQIPITEFFEHLFNDFEDDEWLEFVARVFIKSNSFTLEDKIIVL